MSAQIDWTEAAEKICAAVEVKAAGTADKVVELIHQSILDNVQDYLRDNVNFNLSSQLSSLNSECASLRLEAHRHRATIDALVWALERIERGGAAVLLDAALTDASEGFDECPINPRVLQQIVDEVRAALQLARGSKGDE